MHLWNVVEAICAKVWVVGESAKRVDHWANIYIYIYIYICTFIYLFIYITQKHCSYSTITYNFTILFLVPTCRMLSKPFAPRFGLSVNVQSASTTELQTVALLYNKVLLTLLYYAFCGTCGMLSNPFAPKFGLSVKVHSASTTGQKQWHLPIVLLLITLLNFFIWSTCRMLSKPFAPKFGLSVNVQSASTTELQTAAHPYSISYL